MSLTVDGFWKSGVWASTAWGDGVWREGEYTPHVIEVPSNPPFNGWAIWNTHPWLYKRSVDEEITETVIEEAIKEEKKEVKKELKKARQKKEYLEKKQETIPQDLVSKVEELRIELLMLQQIDIEALKSQIETERDIVFVMAMLAADN